MKYGLSWGFVHVFHFLNTELVGRSFSQIGECTKAYVFVKFNKLFQRFQAPFKDISTFTLKTSYWRSKKLENTGFTEVVRDRIKGGKEVSIVPFSPTPAQVAND